MDSLFKDNYWMKVIHSLVTHTKSREVFLDDWYNMYPVSFEELYAEFDSNGQKMVRGFAERYPRAFKKVWNNTMDEVNIEAKKW